MSNTEIKPQTAAQRFITQETVSSAVLNDKGPDASLKSFEIVDFLSPGEGYLSTVTSVKVQYCVKNSEEKSTSYVVKFNGGGGSPDNDPQKELFAKEEVILRHFLPPMNEILREHNERPLCIPKCYYGSIKQGKECLFLQDMRVFGFKKVKDELGLDVDHIRAIIRELARLHAAFTLLSKSDNMKNFEEKIKLLNVTYSKADFPAIHSNFSPIYEALLENASDIAEASSAKYKKIVTLLRKIAPDVYEVLNSLLSKAFAPFKTLCHADCWVNNILFRYDESGTPVECCLLDFQLSYCSSSCIDLNYLLYSNVSGQVRKENLISFLTFYHDCYSTVFKSAGAKMEFNVDDLHEELRRCQLFGFMFAAIEVPLRVVESLDSTPDLDLSGENANPKLRAICKKYMKEILCSPKLQPRLLDSFDELLDEGILEKDISF